MESNEIIEYYLQHLSSIQRIFDKKTDSDLGRFLLYIVDTTDGNNIPLLMDISTDLAFDNNEDLKKIFIKYFKEPPSETPDGKKITSVFQIHIILYQYDNKTTFIATAESVKPKGFFNKLAGKTSVELWLFWGNLLDKKINAISEEDERLRKLIIRNYYREAEEIFYSKTEYKKVEELLVRCLDLAPNDPDSLILMGRCKLFLSEFEAAEDIFNKATLISPKNPRGWLGLATAQMEIFKINPKKEHLAYIDASERNVDKGRELNPENIELLNLKSGICMLKMDITSAEKYLKLALELKPDDLNSIKNLGLAYLASGNFKDSMVYLEKALQSKPNDESVVYRIIQCLFELKENDRAEKLLQTWKPKARNQNWIQDLENTYLMEVPEEFLTDNQDTNNEAPQNPK